MNRWHRNWYAEERFRTYDNLSATGRRLADVVLAERPLEEGEEIAFRWYKVEDAEAWYIESKRWIPKTRKAQFASVTLRKMRNGNIAIQRLKKYSSGSYSVHDATFCPKTNKIIWRYGKTTL